MSHFPEPAVKFVGQSMIGAQSAIGTAFAETWTVSNKPALSRTFDATETDPATISAAVWTLIHDLTEKKLI